MRSVDVMCGIVLNCQELNCRACDKLGFFVIGSSYWVSLDRWSSSAAAGPVIVQGIKWPVFYLGAAASAAGCALQFARPLVMLAYILGLYPYKRHATKANTRAD
jgi:hypothetical protein